MSKLFGDAGKATKPLRRVKPTQFETAGATFTGGTRNVALQRTPEISRQLGLISAGAQRTGQELGELREQVAPGFGRLTEAGSSAIQAQRRRAISNLRQNLARRRVLGSSFGEDALARAEAEFGQQEAQFRSQAALQEIEASRVLAQQQFQQSIQGAQTIINQSNFETGLAAQLSQNVSNTMANLAQAEAGIRQDFAGAGAGLVGTALGVGLGTALGGPIGGSIGGQFGGSIAGGAGSPIPAGISQAFPGATTRGF